MSTHADDIADEIAGLISGPQIQRELRQRRKDFIERTVPSFQEDGSIGEGWEVVRRNKRSIRIRKPKPPDQKLEDDVWRLLARMDFQYMSEGYKFRIPLSGMSPSVPPKQIDALAVDEDTALVVECKTSKTLRSRSLQKDLNETRALQEPIRRTIHGWFQQRPRVCFLYVTQNIRWSRQDLERARSNQISVVQYQELQYYQMLADIIGPASRHQFQADLLEGSAVRGLRGTVPALRGRFGGTTFYQFVIEPDRLLKLAYISHRARINASAVGAYQRLLRKRRLKDIAQHIDNTGGIFPTNIVVNFRHARTLQFDIAGPATDDPTALGTLHLPNTYKCAWIIDGQHRLYGFSLSDWATRGRVPVLAFEGLDPVEEVKMFVDINSKQVKVPRSLLVELEPELGAIDGAADALLRSLHSQIAIDLAEGQTSPLWDRVATEWDTDRKNRPFTLPQIVNAISSSQLVGSIRAGAPYHGHLYYRDNENTRAKAVAAIEGFLLLFAEGAEEHWSREAGPGGFLCSNNGVAALMRLFSAVLHHLDTQLGGADYTNRSADAIVGLTVELVEPAIDWFRQASDVDMQKFRGHYGSGAIPAYAFALMEIVHKSFSSFCPAGLQDYMESHNVGAVRQAREFIAEIEDGIREVTFEILRRNYGQEHDSWWRTGVPQVVRARAAQKAETSEEGGAPHQFLDLIDYKKIAEQSSNWSHFNDSWSVDPTARSKDEKLSWMNRVNAIRNRVFHSGRRRVTTDEVTFLEEIWIHVEAERDRFGSEETG